MKAQLILTALALIGLTHAKPLKAQPLKLLDTQLSQWNVWIGVPHHSVPLPGLPKSNSNDGTTGVPLGFQNDPLQVFSIIEQNGAPVLKVTGQIYGALTTKEEFQNYHLSLQFKWGEKKWPPRLDRKRDSGLLIHCVGPHGAFWNVWKRSLECQIQEGDTGDFFALAGTIADIPAIIPVEGGRPVYQNGAPLRTISNQAKRSTLTEMPHGSWNTLEIYTMGDSTVHLVNGQVNMVLFNTRQETPHGEAPLKKGQIQIQAEGAEIYYRDILITPITEFPQEIKMFLK